MKNCISVVKTRYERDRLLDEDNNNEQIEIPKFEGPTAQIGVKGGVTLNVGNFQSVRIDVECSLPCYPVKDSLDECYEFAKKFVEDKMKASIEEVRKLKTTKVF